MIETLAQAAPEAGATAAKDQIDPFFYGYRYVKRTLPSGQVVLDQVPLTPEDVLHPQEEDHVTQNDVHYRIVTYLYNVLRGLLAATADAVVLSDMLVKWNHPEIRGHGPDIAVFFGVRERKPWRSFNVAEEDARPALIIEVTSPATRSADLVDKLEHYDLVGVPLYVIVDVVLRKEQIIVRLFGYRQGEPTYTVVAPDERGRIKLAPLNVWLAVEDQAVVCYDEHDAPLPDYAEALAALAAETAARAAAEQRIAELEAKLHRLRGEA
jgi:Uma2 family endonuclease